MLQTLPIRKIIHVDMDAFYASVAQLDNPELKGKAIAVGGGGIRGVISAASYEARKFGVKSAMSGRLAIKLCPELIFVKTDFERYTQISKQIRNIFHDYTDLVEPLSLDEAYLDVTENKIGLPSATLLAKEIRQRIYDEVGLTASAGISINKFIAKVASDYNKPNGQKTVNPEDVIQFLEDLDIRKFYGVGKVTAEKMYRMGIFTGKDLKSKSLEYLNENFGKSGDYFFNVVRGIHHSEVKPNRIRKSLAAERTFSKNLTSEIFMIDKLELIAKEVSKRLLKNKVSGKTITLKIKYSDFSLQTRSKTLPYFVSEQAIILDTAKDLLFQEKLNNSVRLLGISLSNLNTDLKKIKKEDRNAVSVQLKIDF
ncbi:DNA polymerase IV [Winogradskyella litoriviva]|uniref:DNA polymerase IV n=1 Tax=Winogradskyella litoriviva TaxID=1220182 RepID=A0ABX2E1K6_9FLAO|nr:DNA polymerase IV [Winogradskyella litoriviva]NRD22302.1 DNA polymerase IV [Winogradskyella litoriviva]